MIRDDDNDDRRRGIPAMMITGDDDVL